MADTTVGVIDETDPREFKFKFQSFVFAKLGDTVFVHCTVVVCEAKEKTKTCTNVGEQVFIISLGWCFHFRESIYIVFLFVLLSNRVKFN